MHEPDICAGVVERLLHIKVKRIDYPELEKTIAPYYTTKGVRLRQPVKEYNLRIYCLVLKVAVKIAKPLGTSKEALLNIAKVL
ncbi:MAG: hypothetical protein IJ685_09170 [Selenomonadaceae bacterium]|nr:hypothetical protein [Selenomonadaceae bacterium]